MDFEALWMIAATIFFMAGIVKGLVGIGLPTAVIGLLSQFIDPRQAIALLLIPMLVSNIFQAQKNGMLMPALKRFWPFALMLVVGILIFTHLAAGVSANTMALMVGVMIVIFVLVSAFGKPLVIQERYDRPAQFLFGSVAGVMGGLTALWAPPMVIYLMSKDLEKDKFVGVLGFLLVAGSVPLLFGYWQSGLTSPVMLYYSLLMTLPTLAGVWVGEKGRNLLNGDQFRWLLLLVFFVLGLNLIRGAVFG